MWVSKLEDQQKSLVLFSFLLHPSITLSGFWNPVFHGGECQFKIDSTLSSRISLVFKSSLEEGKSYKKIQWLFQGISKKCKENQLVNLMVVWFHGRERAFVDILLV